MNSVPRTNLIGVPKAPPATEETAPPCLAMRPRDAAKALGISERTLWQYTKPRGPIPPVRIGGRVLYDPCDLTAWIDAQKEVANV